MREQILLAEVISKRRALDELKEQTAEAQKEYDRAEQSLIDYMVANQAVSTAQYPGLGKATMAKEPSVYASYDKDKEPEVFAFLQSAGVGDIIKPAVNPRTLSAVIKEWIAEDRDIPETIKYYLKQRIRVTGADL